MLQNIKIFIFNAPQHPDYQHARYEQQLLSIFLWALLCFIVFLNVLKSPIIKLKLIFEFPKF